MSNKILDALNEMSEPVEDAALATVAAIDAEGVSLVFDGQEQASEKRYKGNTSIDLAAGDRVKLTRISGTWLIDYKIGVPGVNAHELPAGGADGQVLTKDGAANYAAKWSVPNSLPAGGTDGQVLTKDGNDNYAAKWVDAAKEIPQGGTNGQVLTKNGNTDYSVKWATPESAQAPETTELKNGSKKVSLSSAGVLAPGSTGGVDLGSGTYKFGALHASGTISLGSSYGAIGFFGKTPTSKRTLYSSASLADVISLLQAYGLA